MPNSCSNINNPETLSCIDLIITNFPGNFQSCCVIETVSSYFHKVTLAVMKSSLLKLNARIKGYKKYSSFCSESSLTR